MPSVDMFGPEFAEVYDLTYRRRGKDYAAEAALVARVARDRRPDATSLLDVACGTGEHLAKLRDNFADVAGLDASQAMIDLARAKLPGVPVRRGDMREFDAGRRFDVVTCLFSSIGYLMSVAELRSAVRSMARHLHPGGVLLVEPLWLPEQFIDGYVAGDVLEQNGHTLARMSHSTRDGRTVRMDIHYLVAGGGSIRHIAESHLNTLFTRDEYLGAVTDAGCAAEFLPGGPSGRGLLVGVRHAEGSQP
jgi:dTDP-3-amino-3,4,6-trideoxy-alpha-D-glucopyranose N,N-dimethyltransferase